MATTKKLMGTTAAAGGGALAIEDVFSTYLYTGNGSTQTITNGIDLAGEGGLVWIKQRNSATNHSLVDSERGVDYWLRSNTTGAQISFSANSLSPMVFNSDGFTTSNYAEQNVNGGTFASWTFRKAPRFFDVVTYTGTGATQNISHNLGVEPGCIIVKCTNLSRDWGVYHRGAAVIAEDVYLKLNLTNARSNSATYWNDTAPTDTEFTLGTALEVNQSGASYVAYLFAHDPLGPSGDGSDGLIACGSYTGNGSTTGPEIDLGWEPQWVMVKAASESGDWYMYDTMRRLEAKPLHDGGSQHLLANTSDTEPASTQYQRAAISSATGFSINGNVLGLNTNSQTYIYIAIRRGPMRQPTSGTEVFAVDIDGTSGTPAAYTAGFPVDLGIYKSKLNAYSWSWNDRLRGKFSLKSDSTAAETANSLVAFDNMTGWADSAALTSEYPSWMLRRAPGFFDVVMSNDTSGAAFTVNHNLGVEPELIITKQRDGTIDWWTYPRPLSSSFDEYLRLNGIAAANTSVNDISGYTDSTITFSQYFSNRSMVFYLFATLPGVSKVGSYTGNGTSQTIDCGFTSGARFILIKRTDSTGDWYIWDTERGIVAANDPHLSLNTTVAEVTTDDSVDPDSSGFIVNQVSATNINVSSASYIFYAIA